LGVPEVITITPQQLYYYNSTKNFKHLSNVVWEDPYNDTKSTFKDRYPQKPLPPC